MSRYYEMLLQVETESKRDQQLAFEAVEEEWPWEEAPSTHNLMEISGRYSLYGGETALEFTTRVSHRIWNALGKYIKVTVVATYLEELPFEKYSLSAQDHEAYLRLVTAQRLLEEVRTHAGCVQDQRDIVLEQVRESAGMPKSEES
jgi:hypothetical protein